MKLAGFVLVASLATIASAQAAIDFHGSNDPVLTYKKQVNGVAVVAAVITVSVDSGNTDTLILTAVDKDGKPNETLKASQFQVASNMTEMDMGNPKASITATGKPGVFSLKPAYTMPGEWVTTLVIQDGALKLKASFHAWSK